MDWLTLSEEEVTAIRLSLLVSTVAVAASLPFGILVALALSRGRFVGKSVLNGIVHLPLILPPVVTGYLLLISFGKRGPIGAFLDQAFGIVFSFRWTGAALACAVMGFPLLVRAIRWTPMRRASSSEPSRASMEIAIDTRVSRIAPASPPGTWVRV